MVTKVVSSLGSTSQWRSRPTVLNYFKVDHNDDNNNNNDDNFDQDGRDMR